MLVASILKAKGADVVTTMPDTKVGEAVDILRREHIGVIVITGRHENVAGILSERDIVYALAEAGAGVLDRPVADFMTADVICCTPNQSLEDLMREMTDRRIRHLPVMNGQRLAGIISIGDVVKYRLGELKAERDALQDYIATG